MEFFETTGGSGHLDVQWTGLELNVDCCQNPVMHALRVPTGSLTRNIPKRCRGGYWKREWKFIEIFIDRFS